MVHGDALPPCTRVGQWRDALAALTLRLLRMVAALPGTLIAAEGRGPNRSTPQYIEHELRRRGGFVPLLHLLPDTAASATSSAAAAIGLLRPIPWSDADKALRAWACTSKLYHVAVADALRGASIG